MPAPSDKERRFVDETTELIDLVRRILVRSARVEWNFNSTTGAYKEVAVSRQWLERATNLLNRKLRR